MKRRLLLSLVMVFTFIQSTTVLAITAKQITSEQPPTPVNKLATDAIPVPPAPNINAKGFVLMDYNTGKIIASKNMNERMAPASLTKMMTSYVVSRALANGQVKLTDMVPVSKDAWKTGGSRMFIRVGTKVPLSELVHGMIVVSGNDACVALSEYIAGTQQAFAQIMNQTAKQLGMNNSHFTDATGLPHPDHYSTPHDLAILAWHLIHDFPQDYKWYSQKKFTYDNIPQRNRNKLLWRDPNVDGIKTGHTKEAGFCLVASAKKQGMRLISVVMGTPTARDRIRDSQALLNYGFHFFQTHKLFDKNTALAKPRVWMAKYKNTPMGLAEDFYMTVPRGYYKKLKAQIHMNTPLQAPIIKNHQYGTVEIKLNDTVIEQRPLIALTDDPKGGIFTRFSDHLKLALQKWLTKKQK